MKSDSRRPAASGPRQPGPRDAELLAGYREMANDQQHEAEAREWCEALIRMTETSNLMLNH